MRHEARATERRAPITPADAQRLIGDGITLTVERSPQRIFPDDEYAAAGAELVEAGSWVDAPDDAVIVGIKELPDEPADLRHTHVFFGHAYKGQTGARELLTRFRRGGGRLLDVEYLTTGGRRVVAFGYWAGYVGASLAVLHLRGQLQAPLVPMERSDLDAALAKGADEGGIASALVTGALGRSGTGARDALAVAGVPTTGWDIAETRELDKPALLEHELLVNCVVSTAPAPPFVEDADLKTPRALRCLSDVTADFTSDLNLVPVNREETTWAEPVRRLFAGEGGLPPFDVIAIDNLPSLLPREASETFSADLAPHLGAIGDMTEPWQAAQAVFDRAIAALD